MGFESCHPAVNFLFFAGVLYGAAAFTHPVFLAIAWASAFAYSLRRRGRGALTNLLLLPLAALFALAYAGSHHFGVTVLGRNFIGNDLTAESFVSGLVLGLRGAAVWMWLECLFSVVTGDKIVYLLGRVSPLLSLGATLTLRFLPRLREQARRQQLARRGIGRGAGQGNWVKNSLAIFSALITWTIQALGLEADAMRSRGSLLRGRTAFSINRFDNRDRAFVVGLCTCATLTAMGAILGSTRMYYNPRILWRAPHPLPALAYTTLCLLPLIQELATSQKFKRQRESVE